MKRSFQAPAATSEQRKEQRTALTPPHSTTTQAEKERRERFLQQIRTSDQWSGDMLRDSILATDKDFVMAVVTDSGFALRHASDALKGDKEVVLTAVSNMGFALQTASTALQADKEVVLAAVTNNGKALYCASEELQADHEIILAAAANNGAALKYASRELLDISVDDNPPFIQSVFQAASYVRECLGNTEYVVDVVMFFPGLKDAFSCLFRNLQLALVQDDDCGDVLPHVFAGQWLARLRETNLCLNRICKKAEVAVETQRRIQEFASLASDIETAILLQTYSPFLCGLMDGKTRESFDSWWGLLEYLIDDENYFTEDGEYNEEGNDDDDNDEERNDDEDEEEEL